MSANGEARRAFEALAAAYRYPDKGHVGQLERARQAVSAIDADAGDALARHADALSRLERVEIETTYTSTFDLAPCCPPYLGVHLFPDDGRDRAALMIGLRSSARNAGAPADESELPDHLSEVLRCATSYPEDEWDDLGRLVLLPALTKMEALLAGSSNPYRHLLAATRLLCSHTFPEGGTS